MSKFQHLQSSELKQTATLSLKKLYHHKNNITEVRTHPYKYFGNYKKSVCIDFPSLLGCLY